MSGYTKGPWVARKVGGQGWPGQTGWAIDFNADQEQVVDFVYDEADALVAAAPDMYEALKELLQDTQHTGHDCEDIRCPVAKAVAALKKADGEL